MAFIHNGIELSPCTVSKAKHALGVHNKHKGNNKCPSKDYWQKTVKAVSEKYEKTATEINKAIELYRLYVPEK